MEKLSRYEYVRDRQALGRQSKQEELLVVIVYVTHSRNETSKNSRHLSFELVVVVDDRVHVDAALAISLHGDLPTS